MAVARTTEPANEVGAETSSCYCPFLHQVIELIGRRWTGAIIKVLLVDERQFGGIRCEIPGLSDRLLAERLTELTDAGLVERSGPGREAAYRLTDRGEGLRPVFTELEAFAHTFATDDCPSP